MLPAGLASLNLNLLVSLAALLEARSVTAAAGKVGVTQSAMSQSLAQLRRVLDDPLLVRAGRGMVLTARAETLAPRLANALADLGSALLERPACDPGSLQRRLVIGSGPSLAFLIGNALHARLACEAPGVEIVFDAAGRHLERLRDGSLDVVVGFGLGGVSDLRSEPLPPQRFVAVLRQDHPLAPPPGEPLALDVWTTIPHVVMGTSSRPDNPLEAFLDAQGLTRRVAMRAPSSFACANAVAHSDLCWNTAIVEAEAMARAWPLAIHELDGAPVIAGAAMVWHARWDHDPDHVYLRGAVLDAMASSGLTASHPSGA